MVAEPDGDGMNGPILHYEDQGSGSPAVVFLHYFAGSLRSWDHVAEYLSGTCRCVRVDLPGFGHSAPLPAYSVQAVAEAVASLVASLALDRYLLVGHSMGGKLALACASAEPAGLSGLVLVAPSPPSPEPMDEAERRRLLAAHRDRSSAEQTLHTITRRPLSAEDAEICIEDNLLTSPEAWRWWLAGGSREDITAQVRRVARPVLVLSGGEDPVISPPVIATQVMPNLPGATRVEIAGAGHLLPLETAREVGSAIRTFVASLEGTSRVPPGDPP